MKPGPAIAIVLLLACAAEVHPDDYRNYGRIRERDLDNVSLGILPIEISDSLGLNTIWRSLGMEKRKSMLRAELHRRFPTHFRMVSCFMRTVICSSVVVGPMVDRVHIMSGGSRLVLRLPAEMPVGAPTDSLDYVLFLSIPFAFDDRDSTHIELHRPPISPIGPGGIPILIPKEKSHPVEECINFGCVYAIWRVKDRELVSVGRVTAEGCGRPSSRYGDMEALYRSTEDLAEQIVEDTPFYGILDESDFY